MTEHLSPGANGQVVRVDARPEPVVIDTARTAVIVVDMQNDFGATGGMLDRAGVDISMIQRAIGPTARVLTAARRSGVKIVYLKMGFSPDLSDLGSPNSPNRVRHLRMGVGEAVRAPDGTDGRILIRDTWNTAIVPELTPQSDDMVLYGPLQTSIQRLLSNRPGHGPQTLRGDPSRRHRMHHERLRGVDGERRDVQGLLLCVAGGLYGRADRTRLTKKQSRGIPPGHRNVLGLGVVLGRVHRCPRGATNRSDASAMNLRADRPSSWSTVTAGFAQNHAAPSPPS